MLFLAAIVVVGLGLWVSSRKGTPPDAGIGQPVLMALKAQLNEVTEVRISRGDGSKTTLKKQPHRAGSSASANTRRDSGQGAQVAHRPELAETVEIKTSDPAKYAQLGVEDATTPTATGTRIEAGDARRRCTGSSSARSSGDEVRRTMRADGRQAERARHAAGDGRMPIRSGGSMSRWWMFPRRA